jgi:hypothetical protein
MPGSVARAEFRPRQLAARCPRRATASPGRRLPLHAGATHSVWIVHRQVLASPDRRHDDIGQVRAAGVARPHDRRRFVLSEMVERHPDVGIRDMRRVDHVVRGKRPLLHATRTHIVELDVACQVCCFTECPRNRGRSTHALPSGQSGAAVVLRAPCSLAEPVSTPDIGENSVFRVRRMLGWRQLRRCRQPISNERCTGKRQMLCPRLADLRAFGQRWFSCRVPLAAAASS